MLFFSFATLTDPSPKLYTAKDDGSERHLDRLDGQCPAKFSLELKYGAQVMLLKNLDVTAGLVNGARGVIVGFAPAPEGQPSESLPKDLHQYGPDVDIGVPDREGRPHLFPVVQFLHCRRMIRPERWTLIIDRKTVASREQIPLQLAWALR